MKKKLILIFLSCLFIFSALGQKNYEDLYSEIPQEDFPVIENVPFEAGEEIEYKIYYSFITVGRGQIKVHKNPYKINNRAAYKVDVRAKTTGMVDWVAKIDDHWGGLIDTASLVPHQAYRFIKEGKYRKNEIVKYDHNSQMLEIKSMGRKDDDFGEPMYYEFPPQIRDLISGFAYFRAVDFDTLMPKDTIKIPAFFEDTFYNLEIVYLGDETLDLEIGKVRAHKVSPVMPETKIFDGENSILGWFSADKNKIPLKINAELYVGSGGLEITSFRNIKYPINFDMSN
ncbi:DUF3108 domain-containing protein [Marivirga sp.]|uniref:DUF3108 domain-containing protein n=1 Tax=Marivirga sp. TaxID=2018662 RepID=UPI003DA6F9C9